MADRPLSRLSRALDLAALVFIGLVIAAVPVATVWRIWQAIP